MVRDFQLNSWHLVLSTVNLVDLLMRGLHRLMFLENRKQRKREISVDIKAIEKNCRHLISDSVVISSLSNWNDQINVRSSICLSNDFSSFVIVPEVDQLQQRRIGEIFVRRTFHPKSFGESLKRRAILLEWNIRKIKADGSKHLDTGGESSIVISRDERKTLREKNRSRSKINSLLKKNSILSCRKEPKPFFTEENKSVEPFSVPENLSGQRKSFEIRFRLFCFCLFDLRNLLVGLVQCSSSRWQIKFITPSNSSFFYSRRQTEVKRNELLSERTLTTVVGLSFHINISYDASFNHSTKITGQSSAKRTKSAAQLCLTSRCLTSKLVDMFPSSFSVRGRRWVSDATDSWIVSSKLNIKDEANV